jgi:hypothetical protein
MRSPEKLVLLAIRVAAGTDCNDRDEAAIVECGGLQAAEWLIHPRGRSDSEAFTYLIDGLRDERNGLLPDRVADLSAAGWNGLIALADFVAPDVLEDL